MIEKNKKAHKLIFEGVELVGKSHIIQQIYDFLEKKYNTNRHILNGCHWFNSDIGIFGTKDSQLIIEKYLEMAEILKDSNIIFEKFHLSDAVYHSLENKKRGFNYKSTEDRLLSLGAKIILCTVSKDPIIFEKRLKDRLTSHRHYERISRKPEEYVDIQNIYVEIAKMSRIPILQIDLTKIPNPKATRDILEWISEA